jgi:hypothetical protein
LDLPCVNSSFICKLSEFIGEYRENYPEINFNLPDVIKNSFGDTAADHCLLLLSQPVMNIKDAGWICHPDANVITELQYRLSGIINDANSLCYSFTADYIKDRALRFSGTVTVTENDITFLDFNTKQPKFKATWKEIEPYANSLYKKEELVYVGNNLQRPEGDRCLKLLRKTEITNNNYNPDYLCIFYQKNNLENKNPFNTVQARFAADMYANKINSRLQNSLLTQSRNALAALKDQLDIDAKVLFPIKMDIRKKYIKERHKITKAFNNKQINHLEYDKKLNELKLDAINSSCLGNELCKKAINFTIDKGLLPLGGHNKAFNQQNPYNSSMPPLMFRINLPAKPDGQGAKVLDTMTRLTGANSYVEPIKESAEGDVPNYIAIMKAWNTVSTIKKDLKGFVRFNDVQPLCSSMDKKGITNLKRKMSLLWISSENDMFFDYFSSIKDFLMTNNNLG